MFGFIPTDVVLARIIPSSGAKSSNSVRLMALPPTLLDKFAAFSDIKQRASKNVKIQHKFECVSII